jgi:hypothetical protein
MFVLDEYNLFENNTIYHDRMHRIIINDMIVMAWEELQISPFMALSK